MISKLFFVSLFKRFKIILIVSLIWFLTMYLYSVIKYSESVAEKKPVSLPQNDTQIYDGQLVVVQTGFYYNTSVLYPDDTVILIFFADFNLNAKQFSCATSNGTETLESAVKIRSAAYRTDICKWTTYILKCPAVINATEFQLTTEQLPTNITVQLEVPDRKPRGIVSCYAPMYFEQRWQTISMIHELNAAFGVDLQVHYVQSVVGEIMELLDPMVQQRLLEFRGLDIPDFGKALTKKLGYNPAQSTEARHQVMALQDCYFRYRESAEFIMVSDPDDLFLPHKGNSLYDEFSHWKRLNPTASALFYTRKVSHISTTSKLENFTIGDTFQTVQITNGINPGKSVYNPKYAETPWIHWPGLNNTPTFDVPPSESYAVHLKYAYDKPTDSSNETVSIADVIDISRFNNYSFVDYVEAASRITDLADPSLEYAEWITACRRRIHGLYQIPRLNTYGKLCTTVTSCLLPQRNVNCTIAVRSYRTECTEENRLCAMLPTKVLPDFVRRSDGCAWGIKAPTDSNNNNKV